MDRALTSAASPVRALPVFASDIDDVLCDFLGAFLAYLKRVDAAAYGHLEREHFATTNYSETLRQPGELVRERVFAFYDSPEFEALLPNADAVQALLAHKDDYRFVLVTARPEFTRDATARWLKKQGLDAAVDVERDVVFCNHFHADAQKRRCKGAVCRELAAAYFVDDHAGHVGDVAAAARDSLKRVFLYARDDTLPWTCPRTNAYVASVLEAAPAPVQRVLSWTEVFDAVASDTRGVLK